MDSKQMMRVLFVFWPCLLMFACVGIISGGGCIGQAQKEFTERQRIKCQAERDAVESRRAERKERAERIQKAVNSGNKVIIINN